MSLYLSKPLRLVALLLFIACSVVDVCAQGFSLCTAVDAKKKRMTLAWNKPSQPVTGYSFNYNGQELTPYRPTIDSGDQQAYEASIGLGRHAFEVQGYDSEEVTNQVVIRFKHARYYTALVPGLYQAFHHRRHVNSCGEQTRKLANALGLVEPVALLAASGYATYLWIQFFQHKSAALNARDAFTQTLQGGEFDLWQKRKKQAQDVFPKAVALSAATLIVHAVTSTMFSPRVRARIDGGFRLDCASHPGGVNLCLKM